MDRQYNAWKREADRFWAAAEPCYRNAAQLVAEIAATGADDALRQAAMQALPSLRNAAIARADRSTKDLAKRRFSVMRDLLHTLTAPRFGKRGATPALLTPHDRHCQALGLPFGRRLSAPEIHDAYKRAAMHVHPDHGGTARDFVRIAAAREALIKEGQA